MEANASWGWLDESTRRAAALVSPRLGGAEIALSMLRMIFDGKVGESRQVGDHLHAEA